MGSGGWHARKGGGSRQHSHETSFEAPAMSVASIW